MSKINRTSNHSLNKPQLLLFFKVGAAWLISNILNYVLLEPTIDNIIGIDMTLTNQHIVALLISLIALSYLAWKLFQMYKEEERLKREDFIDTLIRVLDIEKRLSVNAISNHVKGLKDDFIKPLIKSLKQDEFNKKELIDLLEYDFDHHKTAFSDAEGIDELIKRLELHKSGEIIHDIRHENIKNERK